MSNDTTDVVEERGEYRATITYDPYPTEPENEMGCPVLRIDDRRVDFTGYGSGSAKADGITRMDADDALSYFIDQYGVPDGVDVFDRYLRIFHGGGAVGYHLGYSREYGYVAYVTERMVLDGWGQDPAYLAEHPVTPELDEWRAYCEGEVFYITVERRLLKRTEWVTTDDHHPVDATEEEEWFEVADSVVHGYYGEKWAREAALEMLDNYATKVEVSA